MKLLLDIGNSSVNWLITDQGQNISDGAFSYDENNFERDLNENLSKIKTPSCVLISNVAGVDLFNVLNDWVARQWQLKLWQPSVRTGFRGLKNRYSDISQMGIDRWLAMIAGWEKYQSAICVVSCGTALTIDSIDSNGNHLGGYIIPGIELMQRALKNSTKQIDISLENKVSTNYGDNTQSAVNNGSFLATVATIDYVVSKLTKEFTEQPKCIISGGMAELIKPLLKYPFEYEPNLVLLGLLIAYEESQ